MRSRSYTDESKKKSECLRGFLIEVNVGPTHSEFTTAQNPERFPTDQHKKSRTKTMSKIYVVPSSGSSGLVTFRQTLHNLEQVSGQQEEFYRRAASHPQVFG